MKLLSYGSFSTVYETDDNTVYKILDQDTSEIELTLLPTLDHKNIIKPIKVNFEERYIQMKRYPLTLSMFIKQNDYNIDDVKTIVDQLQDALKYLQSKQVLHCDIKPSNIMIDPKTMEVVIIDFGLSFVWDGTPVKFKRRGSWSYMSPEVCCRITLHDNPFRIDMFSLLMVIYKLLTGKTLLKWKTYVSNDNKNVCELPYETQKIEKYNLPIDDDTIAYYHIQSICDNLEHPPLKWILNLPIDKVNALIRWSMVNKNDIKNKRFIDNLKQHSRFKYDDIVKYGFFKNLT